MPRERPPIDRLRRALPATTLPVARAAAGLLLAAGSTLGWLLLRAVQGAPPREEVATHKGLYAYMLAGAVLVAVFGYVLGRVEEKLRLANRRLRNLARTDELTGLANTRVFHDELPRMVSFARRRRMPLALVMLDVDHFKRLNDTHGHAAGDEVLAAVARALEATARREDLVARVGGEEFAVVLPGVDAPGARAAAERLLAAVRAVRVPRLGGAGVTVSAGVAALGGDDAPTTLFDRADAALYEAKHEGRDRVVVAHVEPLPAARTASGVTRAAMAGDAAEG